MKRRTLLGSAAMTLGGASVIGTGAFTSVRAERSISVDVVGDGSAFLQLEASPNCGNGGSSPRSSDFVYQKDGTIGINLTGDITDLNQEAGINGSRINGSGITKNSLWRFPNAFKIVNQGTQSVVIDFEVQKGSQEITISSPGTTQVGGENRDFDSGAPAVVFYPGSNDAPGNLFNDEKNGLVLSPSDGQCIGFNVRTFGFTNNNNPLNNANLKITADATEADEVKNQPQAGLGINLSGIEDQLADEKFNITGNVEDNSSDGVGDITVELEILNGNGVEVNPNGYNDKLIDDVGPDSGTGFEFKNVTLDSGEYIVRVTATAEDVAPVSDSTSFEVDHASDNIELEQDSVERSDSRIIFKLKNSGDVDITATEIRFESNNSDASRVFSEDSGEVEFNDDDAINIDNNSSNFSLFFYEEDNFVGTGINGNAKLPSMGQNGFYPFGGERDGDWKDANIGGESQKITDSTTISIGEFRDNTNNNNRVKLDDDFCLKFSLRFGDGSMKQFTIEK